jgi:glycosyltransferase involved in cell wall biosynthesis
MSGITVIVPFSRPSQVGHVVACFARQRYQDKRLVVVENGAAVGQWTLPADAVLTASSGPAEARNVGLDYVRQHGGGGFAMFDDDDYYGPGYLEEVAQALCKGADVVGKAALFVRVQAGLRAVLGGPEHMWCRSLFPGCTLAGWADTACEFPDRRVGEDSAWLLAMIAQGAQMWAGSRFGFCYDRSGVDHALQVEDDVLLRCWARGNAKAYDFGDWDPGVVDGVMDVVPAKLELGEYRVSDDPGARAAANRLGWNLEEMARMPIQILGGTG